jgi:hypothetical protein
MSEPTVYHISRCRPVTIEVEDEEEGLVEVEGFFAAKNQIDEDSKKVILLSDHDMAMRNKDKEIEVLRQQRDFFADEAYGEGEMVTKMEIEDCDAEIKAALEAIK